MRLIRFIRMAWAGRRLLVGSCGWHNVKATWRQSDPNWMDKLEPLDLTDEEWDAWMEAME